MRASSVEHWAAAEEAQHNASLFHNAKLAVHSDDVVCFSDEDGLNHIDMLLKS